MMFPGSLMVAHLLWCLSVVLFHSLKQSTDCLLTLPRKRLFRHNWQQSSSTLSLSPLVQKRIRISKTGVKYVKKQHSFITIPFIYSFFILQNGRGHLVVIHLLSVLFIYWSSCFKIAQDEKCHVSGLEGGHGLMDSTLYHLLPCAFCFLSHQAAP